MAYGFFARGNSGQLVISEDAMILTQAFKGKIVVNVPMGGLAYGYCTVTYPQLITSDEPPFVFAVPTPNTKYCGLGYFMHLGGQGGWSGFTCLVTTHIFAQDGSGMYAGYDTGWEYRVCAFGMAGDYGYSEYGLRIQNEYEDITYDSAWPVVKFRGLMAGWVHQGFTSNYAGSYWGYRDGLGDIDTEDVLAMGTHTWGHADLTTGFMLSGVAGGVTTRLDQGRFDRTVNAVVTMGFPDGNRANIWATAFFGTAQHPSGDLTAMRNWNLLTADLTGA